MPQLQDCSIIGKWPSVQSTSIRIKRTSTITEILQIQKTTWGILINFFRRTWCIFLNSCSRTFLVTYQSFDKRYIWISENDATKESLFRLSAFVKRHFWGKIIKDFSPVHTQPYLITSSNKIMQVRNCIIIHGSKELNILHYALLNKLIYVSCQHPCRHKIQNVKYILINTDRTFY